MKKLLQIKNFIDHHPLAGRHRIRAYWKFLYWQVSQFLYPHETIVKFAGSTRLAVKKGLTGATGNIYTGLDEFTDMGFLLHFLQKEDLFFDVGANVGSYTILASGYKGVRTVSFEPVPSTFEWLKKNIVINDLTDKVEALNIGLGSSKSVLYFTKSYDTVNHVVADPKQEDMNEVIKVAVEDFDSIAARAGVPNLVKIDVEGFETEVLNGMSQSLQSQNLKAIIIELNGSGQRYGFDEKLIHEKLLKNGFQPYQYNPFKRSLDLLQHFGSHNTIYIKDIPFVKSRVETAEKVSVFSESF